MKQIKLFISTICLFLMSGAHADLGGMEGGGMGTPWWAHECYDSSQENRVLLMRVWPNYDRDILVVNGDVDENVTRIDPSEPGGPVIFQTNEFELSIQTSIVHFREERVFHPASFTNLQTQESMEMLCEPDVLRP